MIEPPPRSGVKALPGHPTPGGMAGSHTALPNGARARRMTGVRLAAPKITITCDCGAPRRLDYGDAYTCECGRRWSTTAIPAADYERLRSLDRRYRLFGWVAGGLFAGFLLFLVLTRPTQLLFVTPGMMAVWFGAIRPVVRRRHWRQVQALTRRWTLRPES